GRARKGFSHYVTEIAARGDRSEQCQTDEGAGSLFRQIWEPLGCRGRLGVLKAERRGEHVLDLREQIEEPARERHFQRQEVSDADDERIETEGQITHRVPGGVSEVRADLKLGARFDRDVRNRWKEIVQAGHGLQDARDGEPYPHPTVTEQVDRSAV